jgi:N-methylhydantoinase A/oxoprolinase/acetone carboxylase beta subunit
MRRVIAPLAGGVRLDAEAAAGAVGELGSELGLDLDAAAAGIARVAAAEMAQAVRVVTVERGIDPRELALVAFGGAGPLHAAQIATELGMRRVIAPLASGVLSALGLIVSERRRDVVESVLLAGAALERDAIGAAVARLGAQARRELGEPAAGLRATYDLRYAGQAFELSIDGELEPEPAQLRAAFDRAHEERYGYSDPEAELELVTLRVAAALPGPELPPASGPRAERRGTRAALFDGERLETAVYGPGDAEVDGPAIFELPGSTLVVPPGWQARADAEGVVIQR